MPHGDRRELELRIISCMVGRSIEEVYPARNTRMGDELLRVENLTMISPRGKILVKDLSFTLKRGEVVGLAGLLGAGRSETFETLFGVLNGAGPRGRGFKISGKVLVKGRE